MKKVLGRKSLTLVEVVVAMVILSLTTTGLFAVFVSGRSIANRSRRKLIAINYARQVAESLKSSVRQDTYNDINLNPLACVDNPPASRRVDLPSALLNLSCPTTELFSCTSYYEITNIPIDPGDPNNPAKWMRRVTITVTWNEPA